MPQTNKTELTQGFKTWREKGKITNRTQIRSWLFEKSEIEALIKAAPKPVTHLRCYLYQTDENDEASIRLAAFAVAAGDTAQEENLLPADDRYTVSHPHNTKEDTHSDLYTALKETKNDKGILQKVKLEDAKKLIRHYLDTENEYPLTKDNAGNIVKIHAFRFPIEDVEGALQRSTQYLRMYMASKKVLPNLPIKTEEEGLATLVMVGTDQEGKDIYNLQKSGEEEDSGIYDITQGCPSRCGGAGFPNDE